MRRDFADELRGVAFALVLAAWPALPAGARADDRADFHAAIEQASIECRGARDLLETGSPEATAAAVGRIRDAWAAVIRRFGQQRPAMFSDDQSYTTAMLDMDLRIVGTQLIINAGHRDAARQSLAAIDGMLSRLSDQSAP